MVLRELPFKLNSGKGKIMRLASHILCDTNIDLMFIGRELSENAIGLNDETKSIHTMKGKKNTTRKITLSLHPG